MITLQPVKQEPKELVFGTVRTSPEVIDLTNSPPAVKEEPVDTAVASTWKGKGKAADMIDLTMAFNEE